MRRAAMMAMIGRAASVSVLVALAAAARPCERLPVEPTDIFFLADTTSSMGSAILSLQQQISPMVTSLRNSINDLHVGAAEYRDHTSTITYRINLGLADNSGPQLATALQAWEPVGGGDTREAQIYALYQLALRSDWGAGRVHIIVWFSDAPGHDPSGGVSKSQAIAALQAAGIRVIAIDTDIMNYQNQAVSITSATGGHYTEGEQSNMGNLVESALFDVLVDVAFPGGFPPPAEPDRRLCGWHERTGTIPPTWTRSISTLATGSKTASLSRSATQSPQSPSGSRSATPTFSPTASTSVTGPTFSATRMSTGTNTPVDSDSISSTASAEITPSTTATSKLTDTESATHPATPTDGASTTATATEGLSATGTGGTSTGSKTVTQSHTVSASASRDTTPTGATVTWSSTASTGSTSLPSHSVTATTTVALPPTVSPTPIPPRPVPVPAVVAVARDVAAVADASSQVTTTTVAGATGAATVATHMSRLASLRQSLSCEDSPTVDSETSGNPSHGEGQLSIAEHPLRFSIPTAGPGATFRAGAILGELAITAGVAAVVCLVVAPLRWQIGLHRSKQRDLRAAHAAFDEANDDPESPESAARKTYQRALAWCRFPGCMVVVLALVAPRIAESATAVFLAPRVSMTGFAIAAVGSIAAFLLVAAVVVVHRAAFSRHFVAVPQAAAEEMATRDTHGNFSQANGSRERIARLVDNGEFVWVARDAKQTDDLMRAFGFYFDPYGPRAPWFVVVEIASAVAAAVLSHLQDTFGCAWTAWLTMAVAVVYAAVILAVRPHRVPLDRVCYSAAAMYQALCGLAVAVVHTLEDGTETRDRAEAAVSLMLSLSALAIVCLAVYEAFKVVYMQLVIRWRKLDARAAAVERRLRRLHPAVVDIVAEAGADRDALDASLLQQQSSDRTLDAAIDELLLNQASDPAAGNLPSFSSYRSGFLDELLNDNDDGDYNDGTPPEGKPGDSNGFNATSDGDEPQDHPRARAADSRQHRMHDALHHALHTTDIDAGATQMAAAFRGCDESDPADASAEAPHTIDTLLTYDAYDELL